MIEISSQLIASIHFDYHSDSQGYIANGIPQPGFDAVSYFWWECPACDEIIMCESVYDNDYLSWQGQHESFWSDVLDEYEMSFIESHLAKKHTDEYLIWILSGKD